MQLFLDDLRSLLSFLYDLPSLVRQKDRFNNYSSCGLGNTCRANHTVCGVNFWTLSAQSLRQVKMTKILRISLEVFDRLCMDTKTTWPYTAFLLIPSYISLALNVGALVSIAVYLTLGTTQLPQSFKRGFRSLAILVSFSETKLWVFFLVVYLDPSSWRASYCFGIRAWYEILHDCERRNLLIAGKNIFFYIQ